MKVISETKQLFMTKQNQSKEPEEGGIAVTTVKGLYLYVESYQEVYVSQALQRGVRQLA